MIIKKPENYLDLSGITTNNFKGNPFYMMNPGLEFAVLLEYSVPKLQHLFLSNIPGINADILPRLNLQSLGLSNNKIKDYDIITRASRLYPNLSALYLDSTGIKLEFIVGFKNLNVLEIDDFDPLDVDYAVSLMPKIELINNYIIKIDE